jgi:hypothetical protein
MYIQLRRTIILNSPGAAAPYTATVEYFDTVDRRPFALQFDSQVNDPAELAKDAEVFRYEYSPGKTRIVYYNGNGSVYTDNADISGGPFSPTLLVKGSLASYTTGGGRADACLDLTGQYGFPPYELEVVGEQGPAKGYFQTAISKLEIYPVRFYNLAPGEYTLRVRDQTGDGRTQTLTIAEGTETKPRGTILFTPPAGVLAVQTTWVYNDLRLFINPFFPGRDAPYYQLPYGTLLDAYLLPGSNGQTWRQVYSGGKADSVYFVDASTTASSSLGLDNLILFNVDTTAEQNGGAIVEVQGATAPVSFTLLGSGAPVTNATGRFDRLAGSDYQVKVADALGGELTVSFTLEDKYRFWKYEQYFDLDSTPHRVEFWRKNFDGLPGRIQGAGKPVVWKSDGLQGALGGQGDLPSVVGSSLELNFLVEIDLFEEVVIGDDRNCRVDYYYNDQLYFRGYIKPNIYTAAVLDGLQPVSLRATDGLADLREIDMRGHKGQRLGGHRPVLHTLLHCLSRCQVSLPLRIYTNRREASMATKDAPEEWATTNRTGYYDESKGEPVDQRTVTDALGQFLGGTLVQRAGAWELRSALEAALPAPGRAYVSAGTPQGDVLAESPTATILPPGENRWHWIEGPPIKNVRPGWKSLKGETDAGWLSNAFWPGNVFSDPDAWLSEMQLQNANGWYAPADMFFPLVLQRTGEKGKSHATQWPRSQGLSVRDERYLTSPPLPLASGPEAVPAFLTFTGKVVPTQTFLDYEGNTLGSPTTAPKAYLPYEVVIDGRPIGVRLAEIAAGGSALAKDTTVEVPLPPLPAGAQTAALRVYCWLAPDTNLFRDAPGYDPFVDWKKGAVASWIRTPGTPKQLFVARRDLAAYPTLQLPSLLPPPEDWALISSEDVATGQLLISSIGLQLRPQGATWEGEDNFRADGAGGSVRPTEPLKVYHPDVPLSAGLFAGNLAAFGKGVGLVDGSMTTSWARSIDKQASPLFEGIVLDQLALRANASRLLLGSIRHQGVPPPCLLDSVDAPNDTPGRRYLVGALEWDTMAAEAEVSLIEIGVGADAAPPEALARGRVLPQVYQYKPGQYAPYQRVVAGGGVRVVAG